MTYFDAFAGVGGFALALTELGHECCGFSEIDKYATQIYLSHFPSHRPYGDITRIDAAALPDFDLLVGGVPCQSWSVAGKRGGFEDDRGNMWWEFVRILKTKQPAYFIAENVKGLLSHDGGNSMIRICEELCGAGYAIDFDVLNSKEFGVPQNRERVFIIGKRLDLLDDCQVYSTSPTTDEVHRQTQAADAAEPGDQVSLFPVQRTAEERYHLAKRNLGGESNPEVFPFTGSFGPDVIEATAGVPQSVRVYSPEGVAPTLFGNDYGGGKTLKIMQPKIARWQNKKVGVVLDDIAPTLRASGGTDIRKRCRVTFTFLPE